MQLSLTEDLATPAPTVAFEQPLNERLRTFLRLEFLYQQATAHRDNPTAWDMRSAIQSLLEIFAITLRSDPKPDIIKELERRLNLLREYQHRPGVDTARLQTVMQQLQLRREELQSTSTTAIARLGDNDLLAAIKHRSTIPGGTCEFDLPGFAHWLRLPDAARRADFTQWLEVMRPICETVQDLLWLTRESERARAEVARQGNFQVALDRDTPRQMLRITLPADSGLYPVVSGNQQWCSIRFLRWVDAQTRATQSAEDVNFTLGFCH